jgi:hypothetical protein
VEKLEPSLGEMFINEHIRAEMFIFWYPLPESGTDKQVLTSFVARIRPDLPQGYE